MEVRATDYRELFAAHREYLWGLCYRMTGSAEEADDLVQETFARALAQPPADTSLPWRPWLAKVASHLSIDALRKRRRRSYVGPWLPGMVETPPGAPLEPVAPASDVELRYAARESLSYVFMLALENLTPSQRATLLLRDAFGYSGPETADILGISPENVRITLHRARRRMTGAAPEDVRTSARHDDIRTQMMLRLMAAAATGDTQALLACLADDARLKSDGGGEYAAALKVISGRDAVTRFFLGLSRKSKVLASDLRQLNAGPVMLATTRSSIARSAPHSAIRVDLDVEGRIRELHVLVAPAKLHGIVFPEAAEGATPHDR